ncbi:MAG: hypothetical protein ACTSP4_00520 [Candidatus Hodarchaeales archaeon]
MPSITYKQSSFSRGELDPRLYARDDTEDYIKGARELRNVLVVPQGGLRRRFGSEFIADLSGVTDKTEARIVMFERENTETFVLVYTDLLITVYENDVLLTTVVSPYTKAQLPDVRFAQTASELISVHKEIAPYQLTFTSPATFTYTEVNFKNESTYDFYNNYDHADFKVSATSIGSKIEITIDSTDTYPAVIEKRDMVTSPPAYVLGNRYIHTGAAHIVAGFSVNTGDIVEGVAIAPYGNVYVSRADGLNNGSRPANNHLVFITTLSHYYEFNSTSRTWLEYGAAKFQFTENYVGGIFKGNEGTARFTDYISGVKMKATVIDSFKSTDSFSGSEAVITEPIFNGNHGWPRAVGFYQNRVWLGGLHDLPTGLFGSSPGLNNFFNFDDSGGDPENSISLFVETGQTNVITDILGAKNLVIFTSSGVSVNSSADDSGITPGNAALSLVSAAGVANLNGVFMDNQVMFVDGGGKIIHTLQFSVQVQGYLDQDISILSQHLIRNPVSMALFQNPTTDNGLYLIVVNGDGTLAILESLAAEDVKAWTLSDTAAGADYFRHIASTNHLVYFITEREINSVTKFYLEKLSFDALLDCAITGTNSPASTTISGLSHLEGETVQVRGDGFYYGEYPVTSGAITVNGDTITDYLVGMPYESKMSILPVAAQGQSGSLSYRNKTYRTLYLDYYDSIGLNVNGNPVEEMQVGSTTFGQLPQAQSGFTKYSLMAGWDIYQLISCTQNVPFDFHIRAYALDVEVD